MYEMVTGLGFERAIDSITQGGKVTREEWKDKRHYGLIQDGILQIHKAGESDETLHPWILSEADLNASDWIEL